jgi:amino acid adenylation domain-containing protein
VLRTGSGWLKRRIGHDAEVETRSGSVVLSLGTRCESRFREEKVSSARVPHTMLGNISPCQAWMEVLSNSLWGDQSEEAGLEYLLTSAIETTRAQAGSSALDEPTDIDTWNDTARPLPEHGLARLFQDQAQRAPDHIAVVEGSLELTYGELNSRANRLARHLRQLGVDHGAMVAISMPRSVDMIVGVLAIIKAGGVYVPLDPDYPQSRLEFMLADTAAMVVVTTAELASRFAGSRAHILRFDVQNEALSSLSDDDLELRTTATSLAYVLYTSGSTGQPKGVMIPQRAVVRLVINTNFVQIVQQDRVAHASNSSFDAATFEIWGALLNGAALVIVSRETLLSPSSLRREIVRSAITTMFLTTALFNEYGNGEPELFAGLTHLVFGGEVVDPKAIKRILQATPPARLINGYGPTETTTFALWHEVPMAPEIFDHTRPVPVGRPLANTRVHILDTFLKPVPIGAEGEIHIEGPGLAEGYLNQPELTAERFITVAEGHTISRLYKTGDLGRWTPDGVVEYLGRTDQQIKLRGFRIELGEIESTLRRCPGIREGVVLVYEHPPGNKFLHAHAMPDGGLTVNETGVRQFLAEQLPGHMIPARISIVDQMPLTANGKIDRQALRSVGGVETSVRRSLDAGLSPLEEQLVPIWADVLGMAAETLDVRADFLELGGNSLIAVQIGNRLASVLGLQLSAREVLELGTIERIAGLLAASHSRSMVGPDLAGLELELRYPATASQQQVAFFSLLVPGTRAYLTQSLITFRGSLDLHVLRQSIQDVVDRHEHLRTTYRHDASGRLWGEVASKLQVELPFQDLRDLPRVDRDRVVDAKVSEILQAGIDPAELPLAKWFGFQIEANEYRMLMIEHHYVHDGWSFRLFLKELSLFYTARSSDLILDLVPATQFRVYAAWQRRWLDSKGATDLLCQWVDYLDGSGHALLLPMVAPRPRIPTLTGGQLRLHLSPQVMETVSARAADLRLTLFQFMFGVFAQLIGRYTGKSDFLLGTSAANRPSAVWESVLGMLVNVVPVRIRLDPEGTAAKNLLAVADSLQWAVEGAAMPFSTIVEAVHPERAPGLLPLVQIHFSSHNALSRNLTFGDLCWDVVEALPNGTSKFDLGVITIPHGKGGGLDLLLEYNDGLLDLDQVEAIASDYQVLLGGESGPRDDLRIDKVVDQKDVPRSDLPEAVPYVAPASYIEHQLASIWTEILGVAQVGIDGNFFELGGHSLLAARMAIRINALFGVEFPLRVLFDAPTIRMQADHLKVQVGVPEPVSDSFVNVIRRSTGRGNVICVGRHIIEALTLLPRSTGIFYAGSGSMDPVRFQRSGIERAVRRYVDGILRLNPEGPLVVVGFSYGGLVAHALAERLQRRLKVPVVAVLVEPSLTSHQSRSMLRVLHDTAGLVKRRLTRLKMLSGLFSVGEWASMNQTDASSPFGSDEADDGEWQRVGPVLRRNIACYRPAKTAAHEVHLIVGDYWAEKNLADFQHRFAATPQIHHQGAVAHHEVVENDFCVAAWRSLIMRLLDGDQSADR